MRLFTRHFIERWLERRPELDVLLAIDRAIPYGGQRSTDQLLLDEESCTIFILRGNIFVTLMEKDHAEANMQMGIGKSPNWWLPNEDRERKQKRSSAPQGLSPAQRGHIISIASQHANRATTGSARASTKRQHKQAMRDAGLDPAMPGALELYCDTFAGVTRKHMRARNGFDRKLNGQAHYEEEDQAET
jgi:hypothetical protein